MCTIPIPFSTTASAMVSRAKTTLSGAGGELNGNEAAGSFSISTPLGQVKGEYTIAGQVMTVNVTEKPFLLSCGMISSELTKRFTR